MQRYLIFSIELYINKMVIGGSHMPIPNEINNSFDLKSLEDTLMEIKSNSFQYLYDAQVINSNFKRFNLTISDFSPTREVAGKKYYFDNKYTCPIQFNPILNGDKNQFRTKFIDKEVSPFDISNNTDVFDLNFLVFLDGKFYDGMTVICGESSTSLVLSVQGNGITQGLPQDFFNTIKTNNVNVTILVLPNKPYGVYTTDISVLNQYQNQLSMSSKGLSAHLGTDADYISFINTTDFLFSAIITNETQSSDLLRFVDNSANSFDSKIVHLNMFGISEILDEFTLGVGQTVTQIPIQKLPVVVENFIPFVKDSNSHLKFSHDSSFRLYYPNFYERTDTDPNTNRILLPLYFNVSPHASQQYTNDLDVYNSYGILNENTFFGPEAITLLVNYIPDEFKYSIQDYQNSLDYSDTLAYKINKLKDWITKDPNLVRTYLEKQFHMGDSYYLDCSLLNLPGKIRMDNTNEIINPLQQESFAEQRYVFVFRTFFDSTVFNYRLFLDGEFYKPDKYYRDSEYWYIYIPTTMISTQSIIELEKFGFYDTTKDIIFTNTGVDTNINPKYNEYLNPNHMVLIRTDTKEIIPDTGYTVKIVKDGQTYTVTRDNFVEIQNGFSISLNDATLINIPLQLITHLYYDFQSFIVTDNDNLGDIVNFPSKSKDDVSFMRVYRNNRLVSPQYIYGSYANAIDKNTAIYPGFMREIGDEIIVDYTPYNYQLVFSKPLIDNNGFVDLRGHLSKPFSLTWYDVYLNGRKLNYTNITILSPSLIYIKNVNSIHDLLVIEKNRDSEVFPVGTSQSLIERLWDTDSNFKQTVDQTMSVINDIEDVVFIDDVPPANLEILFIYRNIMGTPFYINPDQYQITADQMSAFPFYVENKDFIFLNPDYDGSQNAPTIVKIFP